VMVLGLFLLSRMRAETSITTTALLMMTLGLGLGLVMQVLVLVAQNSVDFKDLGVATSGATLFRLVGGSVGTAVLGAIFASRLHQNLLETLPPSVAGATGTAGANISPRAIAAFSPEVRQLYTGGFTHALNTVFLVATFIGMVGFVLSWLLPETPLRETVAARAGTVNDEIGEVFPRPGDEEDCVDDERIENEKIAAMAHKS